MSGFALEKGTESVQNLATSHASHDRCMIYCKHAHHHKGRTDFTQYDLDPTQFLVPRCRAEGRISMSRLPPHDASVDQVLKNKTIGEGRDWEHTAVQQIG